MQSNPFEIVESFEGSVAEFAGSKYAVAVATGTWALFLSLKYLGVGYVHLPARTFISVPMAVIQAGGSVGFEDYPWSGIYQLNPYPIHDGALRWHRGMYQGGLHCLSFHARKSLPIGEGGMILTDSAVDADWLRAARYSGRKPPLYRVEDVDSIGWQAYMNPEKAARGLHLMSYTHDCADQIIDYPDLRQLKVFQ